LTLKLGNGGHHQCKRYVETTTALLWISDGRPDQLRKSSSSAPKNAREPWLESAWQGNIRERENERKTQRIDE
jgi:hypothetical protein